MTNTNVATVNLSNFEAMTGTGLNKQQLEILLATAPKVELVLDFGGDNKLTLEVLNDLEVENVSVTDEYGFDIESADGETITI
jgi:hypothetical protein